MLRKITQIGKNKYKNWTQINFLLKIPPKNQQFKEISKSAYQKYCWNPDVPDDYILGVMV